MNGIKLQIWATWLFYAVLVDLGDAVADELSLPFDRVSLDSDLARLTKILKLFRQKARMQRLKGNKNQ